MHRKLPYVRRTWKPSIAKLLARLLQPGSHEAVERLARLPEVDHAPSAVNRSRRVEDHARGRIALHVHALVNCVVLRLRPSRKLNPESDGHAVPFPRNVRARLAR